MFSSLMVLLILLPLGGWPVTCYAFPIKPPIFVRFHNFNLKPVKRLNQFSFEPAERVVFAFDILIHLTLPAVAPIAKIQHDLTNVAPTIKTVSIVGATFVRSCWIL